MEWLLSPRQNQVDANIDGRSDFHKNTKGDNRARSETTKADMSAVTAGELHADIRRATQNLTIEDESTHFVPGTLLAQLITPRTVESVLHNVSATNNPELVEFFSSRAVKVFVILFRISRLNLVEHFYKNSCEDDVLPVRMKYINKDCASWKMESYHNGDWKSASARAQAVFRHIEWNDITDFCNKQWQFIPPVFDNNEFRYDFPDNTRLPFIRKGDHQVLSTSTLFSKVEGCSIHAAHLLDYPVRHHI